MGSVVVSTSLLSGELNIAFLGRVLIIVAAVLTIYSMYVYLMAARKALTAPASDAL